MKRYVKGGPNSTLSRDACNVICEHTVKLKLSASSTSSIAIILDATTFDHSGVCVTRMLPELMASVCLQPACCLPGP